MNVEMTARSALERAKRAGPQGSRGADELNYTLTMKRIMAAIEATSERGDRTLVYNVPWLIIDGTSTDNRVLARQLEKRLRQLGFIVSREGCKLYISWDLDLEEEERNLVEKQREERKARMRAYQKKAKYGSREARKASESFASRPPGLEHHFLKGKRTSVNTEKPAFTLQRTKAKK